MNDGFIHVNFTPNGIETVGRSIEREVKPHAIYPPQTSVMAVSDGRKIVHLVKDSRRGQTVCGRLNSGSKQVHGNGRLIKLEEGDALCKKCFEGLTAVETYEIPSDDQNVLDGGEQSVLDMER
jgi:hypothetical protein